MIQPEVVKRLRTSTCAIVHMPVRHEEALARPTPDTKVMLPDTRVIGTGFLVQDNLVLTNRHVVEVVGKDHKKHGHHEHWYLRFSQPRAAGGLAETTKRIVNVFAFIDPAGSGQID